MRPAAEFPALLLARTVDVAIGPAGRAPGGRRAPACSFLRYEVVAVARPGHPLAGHPVTAERVRGG